MRVAFVSAVTDRHRDTERTRRVGRVASMLADRGHDVTVCCAQWWDGQPTTFEHEDITYRALTKTPDDRGFGRRLPGVVRRIDPDVVHAVHDRPTHVLGASTGGTLAGAPLLVDWYDVAPIDGGAGALSGMRQRLRTRLRRRALRAPDVLFAPSRTVETRLREIGADDERIEVVPNGVAFDRIRELEPAPGGDIVYSRHLDDDANLESLLLALAEFRGREWRATVIGDGPRREEYERQSRDLRVDDRVEFVGSLSVDERLRTFKNASVYVHTARRTPFPTDLARALACGCVGIVEYHVDSSAHELVERRERGLLATDDEELVDCIAAATEFPHMTLDESFDEYDEPRVLERYLARYRRLLSERDLL